MRAAGGLLVSAALVLSAHGAAQALDLWDDFKKIFGTKPEPKEVRVLRGFSPEEEVAIGRQAAGNILGVAPLVDDPALQRYVNRVGRWVASQSERPDLEWRFGVIASRDLNAFAAPGGYVLVTEGLYRLLQSESELAGVLAHEIAHVVRRHHLTILQQSQLVDLGGRVLTERVGENETIRRLIGSGAEIFARALDKNAEYEADRIALVLAARAGYDAFGLPAVLQDIGHAAVHDSAVKLLFKTHPHPDDRLAVLGEAAGDRLDRFPGKTLRERLHRLGP
jgi:predicted Zn-dependent protease